MKHTDSYFGFPMKVYDISYLEERKEEDDLLGIVKVEDDGKQKEVDWVEGIARLPIRVFREGRVYWYEGYTKGRAPEEVARSGSDLTIVISQEFGQFVCTWERKKFEERLNQVMEKFGFDYQANKLGSVGENGATVEK